MSSRAGVEFIGIFSAIYFSKALIPLDSDSRNIIKELRLQYESITKEQTNEVNKCINFHRKKVLDLFCEGNGDRRRGLEENIDEFFFNISCPIGDRFTRDYRPTNIDEKFKIFFSPNTPYEVEEGEGLFNSVLSTYVNYVTVRSNIEKRSSSAHSIIMNQIDEMNRNKNMPVTTLVHTGVSVSFAMLLSKFMRKAAPLPSPKRFSLPLAGKILMPIVSIGLLMGGIYDMSLAGLMKSAKTIFPNDIEEPMPPSPIPSTNVVRVGVNTFLQSMLDEGLYRTVVFLCFSNYLSWVPSMLLTSALYSIAKNPQDDTRLLLDEPEITRKQAIFYYFFKGILHQCMSTAALVPWILSPVSDILAYYRSLFRTSSLTFPSSMTLDYLVDNAPVRPAAKLSANEDVLRKIAGEILSRFSNDPQLRRQGRLSPDETLNFIYGFQYAVLMTKPASSRVKMDYDWFLNTISSKSSYQEEVFRFPSDSKRSLLPPTIGAIQLNFQYYIGLIKAKYPNGMSLDEIMEYMIKHGNGTIVKENQAKLEKYLFFMDRMTQEQHLNFIDSYFHHMSQYAKTAAHEFANVVGRRMVYEMALRRPTKEELEAYTFLVNEHSKKAIFQGALFFSSAIGSSPLQLARFLQHENFGAKELANEWHQFLNGPKFGGILSEIYWQPFKDAGYIVPGKNEVSNGISRNSMNRK